MSPPRAADRGVGTELRDLARELEAARAWGRDLERGLRRILGAPTLDDARTIAAATLGEGT